MGWATRGRRNRRESVCKWPVPSVMACHETCRKTCSKTCHETCHAMTQRLDTGATIRARAWARNKVCGRAALQPLAGRPLSHNKYEMEKMAKSPKNIAGAPRLGDTAMGAPVGCTGFGGTGGLLCPRDCALIREERGAAHGRKTSLGWAAGTAKNSVQMSAARGVVLRRRRRSHRSLGPPEDRRTNMERDGRRVIGSALLYFGL